MKNSNLKSLLLGCVIAAGVSISSCKGKTEASSTTQDTATYVAPPPAPVEVAADDALTNGVKDATKDFPGVTASVVNGEIILSGEIQRSKLPTLMQSLNSLNAKKIDNTKLTIK